MIPPDDDTDDRAPRRAVIRVPETAKPRKPHKPTKRRCELPRQAGLTKTIQVLQHTDFSILEVAEALGMKREIVGYHRTNARILVLTDSQGRITPTGRALLELPETQRLGRLYFAFEASEVGRLWLEWSRTQWPNVSSLAEVSPNSAGAFLDSIWGDDKRNTTWTTHESALRLWCEELNAAWSQLHLPTKARPPGEEREPPVVHFDRGGACSMVRTLAVRCSQVDVATGYFNIDGYCQLADNLEYADLRLLIGNDDQSRDQIKALLRNFRRSIDEALQMGTAEKRQAIRDLHQKTIRARVRIRSIEARERGALHAKVYIFGREAALVTSANLTGGGLTKNIEAGAVLRKEKEITYLQDVFDELFREGKPIEELILREIESTGLFLGLQDPHLVFLKILMTLIGTLDDLHTERSFHLAEYQKAIVAAVLIRLEARPGLLLIAPTGIGKTVMTAYLAKVLMERRAIERVSLVSKNAGMRENWSNTLRNFRITAEYIRVFDLERPDKELDEFLADLRSTDLVVVDECHHFRNHSANRSETLRRILRGSGEDSGKRPTALLLTATPMSTGVHQLNALLDLVSGEALDDVADVASSEAALSVPLGGILRWFGKPAPEGHRGLELRDELQYFPKLITSTRRYRSGLTPIFEALLDFRGALAGMRLERDQLRMLTDEASDEEDEGLGSGFLITLLARLAESSHVALIKCIDGLLDRARQGTLALRNPASVTQALGRLRELCPVSDDAKLNALIDVVESTDTREKILIFSEFVATVEHIVARLRERFKDRRIEGLTGSMHPEHRRTILRRFAPSAQRVPQPEAAKALDILVASDAISEGENLQDAHVVIDFDLPWTPLKLIQRVGRVDRFTPEPRVIRVYNLFPEGDEYEQVVSLWSRLVERDGQTSMISGFASVGDHERIPDTLAASATGWLHQATREDLDVGALHHEALAAFPHSRVFDLLWNATKDERAAAERLPDGVQAVTTGPYPGLFVLLRVGQQQISLFRADGEDVVQEAPHERSHEYFLQRIGSPNRLEAVASTTDAPLDDELDALLRLWFGERRPENCQIVASLKIVTAQGAAAIAASRKSRGKKGQLTFIDFSAGARPRQTNGPPVASFLHP